MTRILLLAIALLLPQAVLLGQEWKETLKKAKEKVSQKANVVGKKVSKTADLIGDKVTEKADKVADAAQERQMATDTSKFAYAVSLTDNAGVYRDPTSMRDAVTDVTRFANVADSDRSRASKAMGANRQAERFIHLGKKHMASVQLTTALMVYADSNYRAPSMQQIMNGYQMASEAAMKTVLGATVDTTRFKEEDYYAYARTLDNLGLLYQSQGRYTAAQRFSEQSLKIRMRHLGKMHPATAASMNNLGVIYKSLGKYQESEELLQEAIGVQEHASKNDSIPFALMLNNLAQLYQETGKYAEAKQLQRACIDMIGRAYKGNEHRLAQFKVNLALLHQDLKEYKEAEAIFKELLKLYDGLLRWGHSEQKGYALSHAASLYVEMNKLKEAEKYLDEALGILKKSVGTTHPSYATLLRNYSQYHRHVGNLELAKNMAEESFEIRKETLGEKHVECMQSIEDLAVIAWEMEDFQQATALFRKSIEGRMDMVERMFPGLSEYEKSRFWEKVRPKLMLYYNYAIVQGKNDPSLLEDVFNWQLKTKGMLLSASTKMKHDIVRGQSKEIKTKYLEWIDQKEQLSIYYTLSKAELKEEGINLDSLENAANENEKVLAKAVANFSSAHRLSKSTYKSIQPLLLSKEAAIEIMRLPVFDKVWTDSVQYVALIAKAGTGKPEMVLLANGNEMENKYAKFYRSATTATIEDEYSYNAFWAPIEAKLSGITRVYLSDDGIFTQININTLLRPDGKFVIDVLDIWPLTSIRQLSEVKAGKTMPADKGAILIGYPDYGSKGTIVALPGTEKEIQNLSGLFKQHKHPAKSYTKEKASESMVKEQVKSPRILHIATHGFFLEDADMAQNEKVFGIEVSKAKENPLLRSGLMLHNAESAMEGVQSLDENDNGILTAYEAMNMPLEGTELVVLSACETGLGEVRSGEGVYGLQRAFQVAGARALIMSLWKVGDDASQELMSLFYKSWLEQGNKVTAFKQAQLAIKQKYPEPLYWGAFVMLQ